MVREIIIGDIVFIIAYLAAGLTGIFLERPLNLFQIIYSLPFVAALCLLSIVIVFYSVREKRLHYWIISAGVLLVASGSIIGMFKCDARSAVITAGQIYSTTSDYPLQEVLYKGKYARLPQLSIKLKRLLPVFDDNGRRLKKLKGEFLLFRPADRDGRELILESGGYALASGGLILGIGDFGYSFHYQFGFEGAVDEAFVALRVFPPGREDYFRLVLSPHTYYVRYEPEKKEAPIHLRISRNKDLIYDRYINFHQPVEFERAVLTFIEARKWTRLYMVNDPGLFLELPGLLLLMAGAVWYFVISVKGGNMKY